MMLLKSISIMPTWALVISAVIGGGFAPIASLAENVPALSEKATRELPAALLALEAQKKMPKHSPILIRIFKEESELEVWKQTASGRFELLKTYPICRWSGELGPKLHEGDYQAPEGFYAITPGRMNPNSAYYLAINMGFPNSFDAANGRDGSFIMIHGTCASVGCYAMTDAQISEIYGLARDTFVGGKPAFQVQAYPFRMTPDNMARHRTNPNLPFWQMLKVGNDHFEATHLEPKVEVCDRRYVFDAQLAPGASARAKFGPMDPCPAYEVNPKIAQPALEKQRADDAEYAQLVKDNVPTVPIHTGLDGGMNVVFHPPYPFSFIPLANVLLDGSVDLPPLPPVRYLDGYRLMMGS